MKTTYETREERKDRERRARGARISRGYECPECGAGYDQIETNGYGGYRCTVHDHRWEREDYE